MAAAPEMTNAGLYVPKLSYPAPASEGVSNPATAKESEIKPKTALILIRPKRSAVTGASKAPFPP